MAQVAPIALFVYNRPKHTRKTVEALLANPEAIDSDLFIFSDAAKNKASELSVAEVRKYVHEISGFKSVKIIERESNFGLAKSIIEGVTLLCAEYGRVIVLEDDIVTCPFFLQFMNMSLDKYALEPTVWHISGWNYPIDSDGLEDAFFWRLMNCWGWATWQDRWLHFEKNPQRLIQTWRTEDIYKFNLNGVQNVWKQITYNYNGKLNTWAVFWYATIFEHKGLCLNPTVSMVENIGLDGSGENCGINNAFSTKRLSNTEIKLPNEIIESTLALNRIMLFYKKNNALIQKAVNITKAIMFKLKEDLRALTATKQPSK